MTTTTASIDRRPCSNHASAKQLLKSDPTYQAFWLMRVGFTLLPVLFGADKFAHVTVNWDKYLAPELQRWLSPFDTAHQSMYAVGVTEIVAGLVVLLVPRIGGYLVALWLGCIAVDLAVLGGYWDVLVRDLALFLLALAFARLASAFPAGRVTERLLEARRT